MPIPDFQSCMLPFLRHLSDGAEHTPRDTEDAIAMHFKLTAQELSALLPSGQMTVFKSRVGWARTYIKKAGLLDSPKRGIYVITKRGQDVLAQNPIAINIKFLEQYPEFIAFQNASTPKRDGEVQAIPLRQEETPPAEAIELAHQELRNQLADDLLGRILECSPAFFENLVVELLVKMGYGGSRRDAGERVGQSGDGGIDGIICLVCRNALVRVPLTDARTPEHSGGPNESEDGAQNEYDVRPSEDGIRYGKRYVKHGSGERSSSSEDQPVPLKSSWPQAARRRSIGAALASSP